MSNAKTVRRGSQPAKRATPRRKSIRRAPRPGIAARVAAVLPFSEAGIRRASRLARKAEIEAGRSKR